MSFVRMDGKTRPQGLPIPRAAGPRTARYRTCQGVIGSVGTKKAGVGGPWLTLHLPPWRLSELEQGPPPTFSCPTLSGPQRFRELDSSLANWCCCPGCCPIWPPGFSPQGNM